MTLSEGIEAVGRMIAGYANRGQADKGYIGAIAAILCSYPRQIATQCASPVHGVARECKFLPSIADVVAWCEPKLTAMRAPRDHADRYAKQREAINEQRKQDDYWQKAKAGRPTVEEMKAHYGPNYGLRDPLKRERKVKPYKPLTDDDIRRIYGPRHDEVR